MVALPRVPTMRVTPQAGSQVSPLPALLQHRAPAAGALWKDTLTSAQAATGHGAPSAPRPHLGAPSPTHGSGYGWARP